jgi:hypothetical protein
MVVSATCVAISVSSAGQLRPSAAHFNPRETQQ